MGPGMDVCDKSRSRTRLPCFIQHRCYRDTHDRMIPPGPTTQGKSATVSSRGNVLVWGSTEPTTWTSVAVLSGETVPANVHSSMTNGRLVAVKMSGPSASWKCRWGPVELPALPSNPSAQYQAIATEMLAFEQPPWSHRGLLTQTVHRRRAR